MSWLDKLMNGHGKRAEKAGDQALETYKEKLMGLVYDEEIVSELAPIFAKLHGSEGFDKVVELLETKEQQIVAISGGDWFTQESDSNDEDKQQSDGKEEKEDSLTAEQILENKYKETK